MECFTSVFWPKKSMRVFYIEGNVGVGKTECAVCVCEMLREKGVKATLIEEPVATWENEGRLEDARSDYGSQIFAAYTVLTGHLSRESSVEDSKAWDVVLIERHPTTTLEVFDDSNEVRKLYEGVDKKTKFLSNPENTIYIKNSAHACYERARKRGRPSEKPLQEFAFEQWNLRLDEMMKKREALGGKVFIFDAFGADANHLTSSIVACLGY